MAFSRILSMSPHTERPQLDNYIGYESLPPTLNVAGLARALSISRNAAYALVRDPSFYPAFHMGYKLLISRDRLEEWISEQHQKGEQS